MNPQCIKPCESNPTIQQRLFVVSLVFFGVGLRCDGEVRAICSFFTSVSEQVVAVKRNGRVKTDASLSQDVSDGRWVDAMRNGSRVKPTHVVRTQNLLLWLVSCQHG